MTKEALSNSNEQSTTSSKKISELENALKELGIAFENNNDVLEVDSGIMIAYNPKQKKYGISIPNEPVIFLKKLQDILKVESLLTLTQERTASRLNNSEKNKETQKLMNELNNHSISFEKNNGILELSDGETHFLYNPKRKKIVIFIGDYKEPKFFNSSEDAVNYYLNKNKKEEKTEKPTPYSREVTKKLISSLNNLKKTIPEPKNPKSEYMAEYKKFKNILNGLEQVITGEVPVDGSQKPTPSKIEKYIKTLAREYYNLGIWINTENRNGPMQSPKVMKEFEQKLYNYSWYNNNNIEKNYGWGKPRLSAGGTYKLNINVNGLKLNVSLTPDGKLNMTLPSYNTLNTSNYSGKINRIRSDAETNFYTKHPHASDSEITNIGNLAVNKFLSQLPNFLEESFENPEKALKAFNQRITKTSVY
jgi:hypothetical protein